MLWALFGQTLLRDVAISHQYFAPIPARQSWCVPACSGHWLPETRPRLVVLAELKATQLPPELLPIILEGFRGPNAPDWFVCLGEWVIRLGLSPQLPKSGLRMQFGKGEAELVLEDVGFGFRSPGSNLGFI
jgi:hypothetical protein